MSAASSPQSPDLPSAHQSSVMTPELLWKLGRLGNVAVNPAGTKVAYTVRQFDLTANSGKSDLVIVDLATGEAQVCLTGWKAIGSVYWVDSANGEVLWFDGIPAPPVAAASETSNQNAELVLEKSEAKSETKSVATTDMATLETKSQVYFMSDLAAAPQRSTSLSEGVANFKLAPNGTGMLFTQRVKMTPTANEIYPDLPKADARIIDGLMYRHWDTWHDYKFSHLHFAKIDDQGVAGPAVDLMPTVMADSPVPPFGGIEQFDWSPDGREIAFTMKLVPDWAQSTNSDVYLLSVDEIGAPKNISQSNEGYDKDPLYSPDGKWLAYSSMQRPGFEADRNRLMLVERATGEVRELSLGLDQNANHVQWLPDSSGLIFDSEIRGTSQIFTLDRTTAKLRQISSGQYDWTTAVVMADGKFILAKQMSMIRPQELVLLPLAAAENPEGANRPAFQMVTQINREIMAGLELPKAVERIVTGTDGQPIHCWVIYPPGFDENSTKKWPMLTYCQGGPQSQIGQWFSYRWNFHLMAAQGYVVVAVNRRGLPGFGQKWNDDISGDWGGQAMQDLLSATDSMTAENYIDPSRVAAVGASFGGYSVYWLMGNAGDRFCTMISHCGVFNLESMYGSTEELFFVNHDLGGPYWSSPATQKKYQKFSPHQFVGAWKTPLLVIHGEKDFRVPITQGMEAFTAAQVQGVPSRFLYFPEEGHWVNSPQNSVLWNRVFFEWLDRYCDASDK